MTFEIVRSNQGEVRYIAIGDKPFQVTLVGGDGVSTQATLNDQEIEVLAQLRVSERHFP